MKIYSFLTILFFILVTKLFALVPGFTTDNSNQNSIRKNVVSQNIVANLPLKEYPTLQNNSLPLIFFVSGDGGWTNFDHSVSKRLSDKGFPVIGLDSRKYFWKAKTLDEINEMVVSVLEYYKNKWQKKEFVLVGYSFGADVVPFITTNLPAHLNGDLMKTLCLSPDEFADFEIHISDMFGLGLAKDKYNVVTEVKKIKPSQIVCFFGSTEDHSVRDRFKLSNTEQIILPGNHHFDDNYTLVADKIAVNLPAK